MKNMSFDAGFEILHFWKYKKLRILPLHIAENFWPDLSADFEGNLIGSVETKYKLN